MIPGQRDALVLSLLKQQGVITFKDICVHCDCSPATARRDLRRLEERGLLRRTHGGAVEVDSLPAQQRVPMMPTLPEHGNGFLDRCQVLIVTPTDTEAIRLLVQRARRTGIPIVAESMRCQGAATWVAIDDYQAGVELGRWVGLHGPQYVDRDVKVLDISSKLVNCEARSRGFAEGLCAALPDARVLLRVDGEGLRERAYQIASDALEVFPDINVIFGVNDSSALGALDAYRATGRSDQHLVVVSFGLEGDSSKEALAAGGPFKASVAMFPEVVGQACIDAALCAYHGCLLTDHIVTPHAVVTAETLGAFYHRDHRTGRWSINWAVPAQLPTAGAAFLSLGQCRNPRRPTRLGQVIVFSEHDWYRNMQRAMREHSHDLGIHLESIDASQDADREIDSLKRAIARTAATLVGDRDTIILDGGTTTAYVAAELRGRQGLTVITNSVPVLAELAAEPGITLVSTGGTVRSQTQTLVGPGAESTLSELRADKVFISGTGVSLDFGLSNTNIAEAAVKLTMLRAGREIILLADHSKIGVESLVKVAPLDAIHRLISDPGISPRDRLALSQRGIEVMIAQE